MATSKGISLRIAIEGLSPKKQGRRYPPALRSRIAGYIRQRLAEGVRLGAACSEIDVSAQAAQRCLAEDRRNAFARVAVVETVPRSGVVVRGPCATFIEGLSLSEVAELIRSLSCSA